MATSWQGSHFVVVIAAAGLAFAIGYTMGGNRAPQPVEIGNNTAAPSFPGFDGNQAEAQQPPAARRGRPDENELVAANAEPEDGQPQQPPATGNREPPRGGRDAADRRRDRDDQRDPPQPPPDDEFQQEEQDPYGPEGA